MSLYPGNITNNDSKRANNRDILFPARVKDILLNSDNPRFEQTLGWGSLGSIKFKPIYGSVEGNVESLLTANPLFANIKSYPLINELVLIINSPTSELNDNDNSSGYYYIPFPINIWNNIHHNAFPDINNYNENPEDLLLGSNFEEKSNIHNLLPEEGDVIIEGRFGNSLRFSQNTPNKKENNNSWSSVGEKGSPIIIISNNHSITDNDTWTPTYEDINEDGSSIYLSSDNEIPISYSCKNLKSFDIQISEPFNTSLQILNNKF